MQRKNILAIVVSIILCGGMVLTVGAAYTGPNRTETRTYWERRNCHYQAVYDPPGPGSYGCYLDLFVSPDSGCPSSSGMGDYFNPAVCTSWPGSCSDLPCSISGSTSIGACDPGQEGCITRVEDYSLPEAAISGIATCGIPGNNGWCRGNAVLELSAAEPLAGYAITGIEGSSGILCPGSTCDLPVPEGENTLSFWALSSYGDTSRQGSARVLVDSTTPAATLSITSVIPPVNGWYRSLDPIQVSVTGEDNLSGVASLDISLGKDTWLPSPRVISAEGTYTVFGRVMDNAGNETYTPAELIRIDTTPPIITTTKNHNPEIQSWYTTPVEINAFASDNLSGLDSLTVSLATGGGVEQGIPLPVTLTNEGLNTLNFTAHDLAGNEAVLSQEFSLDLTPPVIQDSVTGTSGQSGWYRSPVSVQFQAEDITSGLEALTLQNPDGSWSPVNDLDFSEDGIYPVSLRAVDGAGWETFADFTYKIDQTPPAVTVVITGNRTSSSWYTSPVTVNVNAEDLTSGVGEINPAAEIVLAESGVFPLSWTVTDLAGNQTEYSLDSPMQIDLDPPQLAINPLPGDLQGNVTLSGTATDRESGLSTLSLSTNGGRSFTTISLNPDGSWDYSWNTSSSPAGIDSLILRGVDVAGNQGEVVQPFSIKVILPAPETSVPTLQVRMPFLPPIRSLTATVTPQLTPTVTPGEDQSLSPTRLPTRGIDNPVSTSPTSQEEIKTTSLPILAYLLEGFLLLMILFHILTDPHKNALKRISTALVHYVHSHHKESHD